jgi:glutaminyl-tRNA synthetase
MALFKNNNGKLEAIREDSFNLEKEMQSLCEKNMNQLFNLEFISSEFSVDNFRIDTLAYDPETKCGTGFTGRKVKGTIHWVPVKEAIQVQARLYENIIDEEKGVYNEDGSMNINPNSLKVISNCFVEPIIKDAKAYDSFQFVRQGYFCVDYKDSKAGNLVFNRVVSLKSSYRLPKKNG